LTLLAAIPGYPKRLKSVEKSVNLTDFSTDFKVQIKRFGYPETGIAASRHHEFQRAADESLFKTVLSYSYYVLHRLLARNKTVPYNLTDLRLLSLSTATFARHLKAHLLLFRSTE